MIRVEIEGMGALKRGIRRNPAMRVHLESCLLTARQLENFYAKLGRCGDGALVKLCGRDGSTWAGFSSLEELEQLLGSLGNRPRANKPVFP